MNREKLEGMRARYRDYAVRGGEIMYALDLAHVLDALLEEEPALQITPEWEARWGADGADTAWRAGEQARRLVENWSA